MKSSRPKTRSVDFDSREQLSHNANATASFQRREKAQMSAPSPAAELNDEAAWLVDEEDTLVDVMKRAGPKSWKDIAKIAKIGRSGTACRVHFHHNIRRNARYSSVLFVTPRGSYGNQDPSPKEPSVDDTLPSIDGLEHEDLFAHEVLDGFSFEAIISLGAQPHLAQPIVPEPPSPTTAAGLPNWTQSAFKSAPQIVPPPTALHTSGASVCFRFSNRLSLATYKGAVSNSSTIFSIGHEGNTAMRDQFKVINKSLVRPLKQPAKRQQLALRPKKVGAIVFNAAIVVA